ncbi:GAL3ST1 [Branchiostoma lanceolatum]|uniref:GAL3ST1 protein n=1 Tax=Branchiostoma lanceolatum TaxID=7740 RepID=A0A8K0AG06_BRALA|nr:GAL3ST1 [Branchiostoma lanceolatum]
MRWVYDKSNSRYRIAPTVQQRCVVSRCLPFRLWKYSLPVVLVLLLAYTVFSVQLQWRSVTWRQPRRAGKETSTNNLIETTQGGKYDSIDNTSRSWTTVEADTTHSHKTIVQTARPTGTSSCVTHTSIAFIKVHKCGSTTLQRSFLRFGFTHRLNVALPRGRDSPTIGHDGLITRDDYEPSPGGARWDMFAHHGTYNRTQLLQLMKKDTKFITSLWRFFLFVTSALVLALLVLLHFEENLPTSLETLPRPKGWLPPQPTNSSSTREAERTATPCQPQTNVAFMKVHKCGSTTVQKVFLRFGHRHLLTVALPRERDRPSIGTAGVITERDYLDLPKGYPNIFAHHAIYNRTGFHKLMSENTKYVAILREPLARLRSSFKYFKMDRYFIGLRKAAGSKPPVLTYLDDPKKWDSLYRPSTRLDFVDHICNRNCEQAEEGAEPADSARLRVLLPGESRCCPEDTREVRAYP